MWPAILKEFEAILLLADGVSEAELHAAEQQLRVSLPHDQRMFLRLTNGFFDLESQYAFAWSLSELVAQSLVGWSDGWLPDRLLPIGGDGAGGYFTLSLFSTPSVRHWSVIAQEEADLGLVLYEFWPGWLRGEINV